MNCQLIIKYDAESYQTLKAAHEQIAHEMNEALDVATFDELAWTPPEAGRANSNRSKITLSRDANLEALDSWDEYFEWIFDAGSAFHKVFYDRVQNI